MEYVGAGSFFSTKASRGNSWLHGCGSSFSRLDDLLDKGNKSSIEEILSSDEVVQELRAGSSKLVDRLCEKSSLQSMVKILTEMPPDGASDTRKYVLPYICVELISCENDTFLDAWVHEDVSTGESALGNLFKAYVTASQTGKALNCVIAGYMSRAISAIFEKRPVDVAKICRGMEESLKPSLLSLLYDMSTCEMLYNLLLTSDKNAVPFGNLTARDFVDVICDKAPGREEVSRNCAELLQKLLCYRSPSEDVHQVYVPELANGLLDEIDRLIGRIVSGTLPKDTPVKGGAANVVTSLLFFLKFCEDDALEESSDDDEEEESQGEDDGCCRLASTPSGIGLPVAEVTETSPGGVIAGAVGSRMKEMTDIVGGDEKGEEEEDVELLTEVVCLVMTAMAACSNRIFSSECDRPDKLVGVEFLTVAMEAMLRRHSACSLLANSVLELSGAMHELGDDDDIIGAIKREKEMIEKCLAGDEGIIMGCRPQVAEILLLVTQSSTSPEFLHLESSAAEAYLSRWRLCREMKLDLGGSITVPRIVPEEATSMDMGRGPGVPVTSLPPVVASTASATTTPSTTTTGAMLGDDSFDSPEFFQAGSHHDASPRGRSPTPEWPGPVTSDWAESPVNAVWPGGGGGDSDGKSGEPVVAGWPPESSGWVTSPTVADTKWVAGSSTPEGWPTDEVPGEAGDAWKGDPFGADTVEGSNMNDSIDLVGDDGIESPKAMERMSQQRGGGTPPAPPPGVYASPSGSHQQQQQRHHHQSKGFFGNLGAYQQQQRHYSQQQHGGRGSSGGRNGRRSQTPPQKRQQQQQQQRTPPQVDRDPGDEDLHNVLRQLRKMTSGNKASNSNALEWITDELNRVFSTDHAKSEAGLDLAILTGICEQCGKLGYEGPVRDMCTYATPRLANSTPRVAVQMLWAHVKVGLKEPNFLRSVVGYLCAHLSEYVAQDISRSIWAFAKIDWYEGIDFTAVCDRILSQADKYNPQDLSMTLWGLSRLMPHITDQARVKMVFERCGYVALMHAQAGRLNPQDVATILKSFGRVGIKHDDLIQSCQAYVAQFASKFSCEDLTSAAWGLCKLGYHDPLCCDAIARQMDEHLDKYSPAQLSTCLWALAFMGVDLAAKDPELVDATAAYVKSKSFRFSTADISTIFSAYARMGVCDCCAIDALADRANLINSTTGLGAQDAAMLLHGLVKLGHTRSNSVMPLIEEICDILRDNLSTLSAQSISLCLWSLVRLGQVNDYSDLVEGCAKKLRDDAPELAPHCLSNSMWALANTTYGDPSLWEELAECCVKAVTKFCIHDYANVLTALAKKCREIPSLKDSFTRIAAMLFVVRVDDENCTCGKVTKYDLGRLRWSFRETGMNTSPVWFEGVSNAPALHDASLSPMVVLDGVAEVDPLPCTGHCPHLSSKMAVGGGAAIGSFTRMPSHETDDTQAIGSGNASVLDGLTPSNMQHLTDASRYLTGLADWQQMLGMTGPSAAPGGSIDSGSIPDGSTNTRQNCQQDEGYVGGDGGAAVPVSVKNTFLNFEDQANMLAAAGRPKSI
ncbi:hypothetical protein FOL47_010245 [Perkinsus chesapeaki]|uniref:RNA-editing substrate-binding complex 6 protein domain-containing protein n=1 Tax=Perkinsus chesapeaki TaxID=330153 RepID=A0A7J6MQ08_PERCH|nr:hypothetical protein FOL47_010245 [Perkinsus chesapeaki]